MRRRAGRMGFAGAREIDKQKAGLTDRLRGARCGGAQLLPASALNFGVRYSAELSSDASCM